MSRCFLNTSPTRVEVKRCFTPSSQHLASDQDYIFHPEIYCDGAFNVVIPSEWAGQEITLIHNCRTHDDWILAYFLVMKLGMHACTVRLILPYVSYGRQLSEYLTTLLQPLHQPHVISILTYDLHQSNDLIQNQCLSALIADNIASRPFQDAVLIAPDKGSASRVAQVSKITNQPVIGLHKTRQPGSVSVTSSEPFPVGKSAIIVDDMVDTGSTLKACADHLLEVGATAVHVYATHGVLSYGFGEWAKPFASMTFLTTLPPIEGTARWISIEGVL